MRPNARHLLGFLSDKSLLGAAGVIDGKSKIIAVYRQDMNVFPKVERFCKRIGLPEAQCSIEESKLADV